MHWIVLYGDREDGGLGRALMRALSKLGRTVHLGSDLAQETGAGSLTHLLVEYETPPRLQLARGVFLFKDRISCPLPVQIPKGFVAVAHSASARSLALLRQNDCPAVVCGMSLRDTVTLSGNQKASAAVSLQRQMVDLQGRTIEAREIPVSLSFPLEGYPLLAVCAVLLLTQGEPEKNFCL